MVKGGLMFKYQIGDMVKSNWVGEQTQETHLIIGYSKIDAQEFVLPVYLTIHLESGTVGKFGRKYIDTLQKVA